MPPDIETRSATLPDPLQAALLRLAICCGDGEAARRCLDDGADPNARDAAGASPLALATALGHAQLCALLLDHGAAPPPASQSAAVEAPPRADVPEPSEAARAAAPAEIEPATQPQPANVEAFEPPAREPPAAPYPASEVADFSDRAYRVAKALLAANTPPRPAHAPAA